MSLSPELIITIASFAGAGIVGISWKILWQGVRTSSVKAIADAVWEQIRPHLEGVKDDIGDIKADINHMKDNGIETKKRISNLEERTQQGARELDALRERLTRRIRRAVDKEIEGIKKNQDA